MPGYRLIENSVEFVETSDFFDKVALVAHNCYQVKDKGHESNVDFVKRLISSGHLAMIEHYRFFFEVDSRHYDLFKKLYNPYFFLLEDKGHYYLSCSLRPLLEAKEGLEKELSAYISSALPVEISSLLPYEKSEERPLLLNLETLKKTLDASNYRRFRFVTYHLITDRGVTHEIVRHRPCSFAQESTRYCNYTKDKFSNELAFMQPLAYDEHKDIYDRFFQNTSDTYFALIEKGEKPDEARAVLPNSLKASIMVSATLEEWNHIFELRCSEFAHPDIRRLMILVRDDLGKRETL